MGEYLPDGSYQDFYSYCKICRQEIKVNIQGQERGKHSCIEKLQAERDALKELVAKMASILQETDTKIYNLLSEAENTFRKLGFEVPEVPE